MTVKRMDNVGIVVEDLDAAIEFFTELGLELEGRATIEGDWADGVTGLHDMRVEIAMMRTPDGHSRLELSRFLAPPVVADHRNAPVNALGYLRVMFAVDDIDDTLARLAKRGAQLVGEVVQYEDVYRLCYIRGPEGILIGLAQQLEQQTSRTEPDEPCGLRTRNEAVSRSPSNHGHRAHHLPSFPSGRLCHRGLDRRYFERRPSGNIWAGCCRMRLPWHSGSRCPTCAAPRFYSRSKTFNWPSEKSSPRC